MTCVRTSNRGSEKGSEGGFTLIELLAVLAVISILVGILFLLFEPIMANNERKQARVELEALRLSLSEFHRIRGKHPHCPRKICTPSETLFLSLIGFHNERGSLQIPPYKSVVHESLLNLSTDWYDPAKVPSRAKKSKEDFKPYLKDILKQDLGFVDPWGFLYVYECPRKDGLPGYRLFSVGPDGETGEGKDSDDVE